LPDPEIVKVEKLVRVHVPGALLIPCDSTPLPSYGDTWRDALEVAKQKDLEQRACNKQLEQIDEWQRNDLEEGHD